MENKEKPSSEIDVVDLGDKRYISIDSLQNALRDASIRLENPAHQQVYVFIHNWLNGIKSK
jgi:hypothetical protein